MQDLVLIILALFSIAYASPNPAKCHCGIPHYENYTARIYKGREEVRDGAGGVALATPFFQDLFYMLSRLLAILTPGYPDF